MLPPPPTPQQMRTKYSVIVKSLATELILGWAVSPSFYSSPPSPCQVAPNNLRRTKTAPEPNTKRNRPISAFFNQPASGQVPTYRPLEELDHYHNTKNIIAGQVRSARSPVLGLTRVSSERIPAKKPMQQHSSSAPYQNRENGGAVQSNYKGIPQPRTKFIHRSRTDLTSGESPVERVSLQIFYIIVICYLCISFILPCNMYVLYDM